MKKPIPYTYVVAARRRRNRVRWSLAVMVGGGLYRTLTTYKTLPRAIEAARLLAMGGGYVEVHR